MDFSNFDFKNKAWCLRTVDKNHRSHGGFKWPTEIGAAVTCDDFINEDRCGNGLHGLLDGLGDFMMLSSDIDSIWQIVEINRPDAIDLGGKVKFESCVLVDYGDMAKILTKISRYQVSLLIDANAESSGDSSQLASSGDKSRLASSGYSSQLASSGYGSRLASSGNYSQLASSGNYSRLASSGNYSQLASSGNYSQLASSGDKSRLASSGYGSQLASSGNYSRLASSGDKSMLASSGNYSRLASSGDSSQLASSGNYSRLASSGYGSQLASSGANSIACSIGVDSVAKVGVGGCIALTYEDRDGRLRVAVGYEGEGIKKDVLYKVNFLGKFVEVSCE